VSHEVWGSPSQQPSFSLQRGHCHVPCRHSISALQRQHFSVIAFEATTRGGWWDDPPVTFQVAAEKYDKFMGRYSSRLATSFADFAGVTAGQRVVDVGSGPGALTTELVARVGAENVAAADPSEPFVEAARQRFPGVDVQLAPAEQLPFADGEFDAALAQLVVHFMSEPLAGLREMARVTKPGGVVAACVWDREGERAPYSPAWTAAGAFGFAFDEGGAGSSEGSLAALFREAGLTDVESAELSVPVEHASFEEWWHPFTLGVGPLGMFIQGLGADEVAALRDDVLRTVGDPPAGVSAVTWAARGRV
jgi:SAM-dependent methyltransferase